LDTLDKILILLKQKKISNTSLASYLNISVSQISNWKSRNNTSYLKYISQIAEFLEVSTDYLLGNKQIEKSLSEKDKLIAEIVSELNGKTEDELIAFKNMLIAFAKSKGK